MTTEATEKQTVILSDTIQKMVDVVKALTAITKDKSTNRQESYYCRQAIQALNTLIANAVTQA